MTKGNKRIDREIVPCQEAFHKKNQLRFFLWLLIVVVVLFQQWLMAGYTMDDAFISFRYARNVAQGEGWVFNPGGPAVEGFTNFLWTLLLVPVFWFDADPMLLAQILGAACSVGTLWLVWRIAAEGISKPRSGLALIAPALLAVTGAYTYQAVTGLETQLYTFALTLGVFFYLRRDPSSLFISSLAFVAATLSRPEGLALFAFSLLLAFYESLWGDFSRRGLVVFLAGFVFPLSLFLLWRWHTFSALLPNTFYAKIGGGSDRWWEGGEYVHSFFSGPGSLLPWVVALAPLWAHRFRPREVYLTGFVFVSLAVVIYEGGDWMPLHRLLCPMLPVLMVLLVEGIDQLLQMFCLFAEKHSLSLRPLKWAFGIWLVAVAVSLFYPSVAVIEESFVRPQAYEKSQVALGKWLKQETEPADRVALSDIGQIGYYSERNVIDLAGLTDPVIGRSPGGLHKKEYNPLYVLRQKPEYIVLVAQKVGPSFTIRGFETEKRIYNHPRFEREYLFLPEISEKFHYKDDYTYWVFRRLHREEFQ